MLRPNHWYILKAASGCEAGLKQCAAKKLFLSGERIVKDHRAYVAMETI
jgi:hypothetical protein